MPCPQRRSAASLVSLPEAVPRHAPQILSRRSAAIKAVLLDQARPPTPLRRLHRPPASQLPRTTAQPSVCVRALRRRPHLAERVRGRGQLGGGRGSLSRARASGGGGVRALRGAGGSGAAGHRGCLHLRRVRERRLRSLSQGVALPPALGQAGRQGAVPLLSSSPLPPSAALSSPPLPPSAAHFLLPCAPPGCFDRHHCLPLLSPAPVRRPAECGAREAAAEAAGRGRQVLGHPISYITVGGRTSAFVPALQRKTDASAAASEGSDGEAARKGVASSEGASGSRGKGKRGPPLLEEPAAAAGAAAAPAVAARGAGAAQALALALALNALVAHVLVCNLAHLFACHGCSPGHQALDCCGAAAEPAALRHAAPGHDRAGRKLSRVKGTGAAAAAATAAAARAAAAEVAVAAAAAVRAAETAVAMAEAAEKAAAAAKRAPSPAWRSGRSPQPRADAAMPDALLPDARRSRRAPPDRGRPPA